ncbi:MAG: tyrosine-type recombinase/integrase [Patescibacteria group bacterium]
MIKQTSPITFFSNLTDYLPDGVVSFIKKYLKNAGDNKVNQRTLNNYANGFKKFYEFAGDIKLDEITIDYLNNQYVKYLLDEKKLSPYTAALNLQILRYLLESADEEGLINLRLSQLIDKKMINVDLKQHRTVYHKNFLDDEELDKMVNYWSESEESFTPRGLRNQVILKLLADTGMTAHEMTLLNRDNINFKEGKINIYYKDNKYPYKNREITLKTDTLILLKRYLDIRADHCQCLIVAFNAENSFIVYAWPLTERSIQRVIKSTAKSVGITRSIPPSVFRNTKFVDLYRRELRKDDIKKMMGQYPTSTQHMRYVKGYDEQKKANKI